MVGRQIFPDGLLGAGKKMLEGLTNSSIQQLRKQTQNQTPIISKMPSKTNEKPVPTPDGFEPRDQDVVIGKVRLLSYRSITFALPRVVGALIIRLL